MLIEFLIIALFFLSYQYAGIFVATSVLMAAYSLFYASHWLKHGKLERKQIVIWASVIVLGGSTLAFHDQRFIMWKPSIVFFVFSIALFINHISDKKPIIQNLLEENIQLPIKIWKKLNLTWAAFFTTMALINTYIIYHYSMDTWMNFKLFGILGATLCFAFAQAIYISKITGQPS